MIFRGSGRALKFLNRCILHYIKEKNNYTKIVLASPDFCYKDLNLNDNASMEASYII